MEQRGIAEGVPDVKRQLNADSTGNRLLSKLAYVSKVEGGPQRRTAVYYDVHEDSSSGRAHKFATEVEFGKKSNVN